MTKLPNISDFKNHKLKLKESVSFSSSAIQNNYDLEKMHKSYIKAYELQRELVLDCNYESSINEIVNVSQLLYELFDINFLRSIKCNLNYKILEKYIGYSIKYKSLTISILDEKNKVQSIAIRKTFDKDGNRIKWKTYGSKTYVPSKLDDSIVFLAVGTAEYVLFELLNVSYILLQADSMFRHIPISVISKMKNKTLIILKENDESFEKLILKIHEIFNESNVYVIDFKKILGKELNYGFDFRDFCNEIKDISMIEKIIEKEIIKGLKND